MVPPSDEDFAQMIDTAMASLPADKVKGLSDQCVVTYADEPTAEQGEKLKLRGDRILLGLFEGVPLTKRGNGWSGLLPAKITLFKIPLSQISHDEKDLREHVRHTLWHEMAHFYGLDHKEIRARER